MRQMHFIDGNDPTTYPGAVFLYPPFDEDLVRQGGGEAVNRRTGDVFKLTGSDTEYQSFFASLQTATRRFFVRGYMGDCERPGIGNAPAFNIVALSIEGHDGKIENGEGADAIAEIAPYFNTMIADWRHDPPRPAVVIDNRAAVTP
jgi:hypothetical protein